MTNHPTQTMYHFDNQFRRFALLTTLSLSLLSLNARADDTNNTVNPSVTNVMAINAATNEMTDNGTNLPNAVAADDSGKNVRDRNGESTTPMDQGNSRADLRITRKIRRAVVNETNNFSLMAQNIKIITRDGRVTLRGPVKTDEEKLAIEKIAGEIAGTNRIDDLLEVKSNSSLDNQTNSSNQNQN